jgi:anaerobic magnesium-protoporphyrin IX monomethyl ester cyclase
MTQRSKVRFIEPRGRRGRPFNAWISRWPLLGPITLASILEQRGYDVAVYNENISGSLLENSAALKEIGSADVVGISVMTPTAARGYAIADRLRLLGDRRPRRSRPGSPGGLPSRPRIVFGGVHATFRPEEALQHADIVVRGEGESVIEAIASGEIRAGIIEGAPVEDLDSIPTLNHSLMRDFDKLFGRFRPRESYQLPVMASRGCPYGCEYCTVTRMFGRRVRRQSVEKVHHDICRHAERGFRHFFFYDDNFTTQREWTKALLERLLPMRLRFNAQVRADFHWLDRARRRRDDELLRGMRKAGGDVLYIGYETIDEHTAEQWHKGYGGRGSLKSRLMEDSRILHDNGFWIHGMFVLGPQHTRRTADQIVGFARRTELETLQISILTPFPGTPLMEQMRPYLVLNNFPGDWDYYDGTHCVYGHSRLGIEAFQKTVLEAHRRFYSWGGWSLRRLRALAAQRVPILDKLGQLWCQAATARTTLRSWQEETRSFLETVRARAIPCELRQGYEV